MIRTTLIFQGSFTANQIGHQIIEKIDTWRQIQVNSLHSFLNNDYYSSETPKEA